jgi:hypothetical protein
MDDGHRSLFPPFRYLGAERLSRAIGAVEDGRTSPSDRRVLTVAVMALAVPVVLGAAALLIRAVG